jgi:hypothetical protein
MFFLQEINRCLDRARVVFVAGSRSLDLINRPAAQRASGDVLVTELPAVPGELRNELPCVSALTALGVFELFSGFSDLVCQTFEILLEFVDD